MRASSTGKSPFHTVFLLISFIHPGCDFLLQDFLGFNQSVEALSAEVAKFNFSHIQPTAVFGRVMNFQFIRQPFGLCGFKSLIQRGFVMGVQIIHDQYNGSGGRIMLIYQLGLMGASVRDWPVDPEKYVLD